MCPKGWWENESKKDELPMPRLTPVTPMPRESGREIQDHICNLLPSTDGSPGCATSVTLVFIVGFIVFNLFGLLTCGHRRSARPPLVDVVQDRKGPPVRSVGLEKRAGQAQDAACTQAAVEVENFLPCKCE